MINSYMPVVLRVRKKNDCIAAALEIFRISGMLTSNMHILALAINQFIGIVYPLKYKVGGHSKEPNIGCFQNLQYTLNMQNQESRKKKKPFK